MGGGGSVTARAPQIVGLGEAGQLKEAMTCSRSAHSALPFSVMGGRRGRQQVPSGATQGVVELGMASLPPRILLPPSPVCHRGFPSLRPPQPALLKKEF